MAVSTAMPGFLGFACIASSNPDLASNHTTPSSFKDVLTSPDKHHWLKAIAAELKSIRSNDTYELVDRRSLPPNCNIIGFTWVFKLKQNKDGTIKRYKARCTAMGCSQVWGVDYDKTFAPVASSQSVRLLLGLSQILDLQLHQYDVTCAFLNGELPDTETVYMRSPCGSGEPSGSIWKLKRCIYGLKQASRRWNQHLHQSILSAGLTRCVMDPCLYHHHSADGITLAAIVVDDILVGSNCIKHVKRFEKVMNSKYDFTHMGFPAYMIGMELNQCDSRLELTQTRYLDNIFTRFSHLDELRPISTPAATGTTLCKAGTIGAHDGRDDDKATMDDPCDTSIYRSLVGSLMYTLISRPDVSTSVSICARYMQAPTQSHLRAAIRILRYLKATRTLALHYHKQGLATPRVFVDSDWGADIDTRRSRFGYAVYVGTALIDWTSKLHNLVALSSMESEYNAATEAARATSWVRHMLEELRLTCNEATPIYEDNDCCTRMTSNLAVTARNRHMGIRIAYLRQQTLELKTMKFIRVDTKRQVADILTKNLAKPAFETLRAMLMGHIQLPTIAED